MQAKVEVKGTVKRLKVYGSDCICDAIFRMNERNAAKYAPIATPKMNETIDGIYKIKTMITALPQFNIFDNKQCISVLYV